MVGFAQHNIHHCYDVYTHTAVAVDHVPPEVTLRLAALFHDLGKPATFSMGEDGQGHFYGHPKVSAALRTNFAAAPRPQAPAGGGGPPGRGPRLAPLLRAAPDSTQAPTTGGGGVFCAPGPPEGGRCGLFFVRLHKGRRSKCGGNGGKGHLSRPDPACPWATWP